MIEEHNDEQSLLDRLRDAVKAAWNKTVSKCEEDAVRSVRYAVNPVGKSSFDGLNRDAAEAVIAKAQEALGVFPNSDLERVAQIAKKLVATYRADYENGVERLPSPPSRRCPPNAVGAGGVLPAQGQMHGPLRRKY